MAYDAFVSYSHAADGLLAPRLQTGLQKFAKPWWRRRALRVFRDETGLSVNPHLWSSITDALDESEWFILLASEEASRSPWIEREISYWKEHKDPARILPVVTGGEWVWDEKAADFDWGASTAVPAALAGVFVSEPRHLDLRWARAEEQLELRNGRFRGDVAQVAAAIRGVPKDDLEGEDVRQHRRTLRWAWGAAVALVLLTLLSAGTALAAVRNADEAQQNAAAAVAAQAEAAANANEADANANEARTNANQAQQAQRRADANATEAQRRKEEADANATQAQTNADQAQEAQAEADANANEAEISAAQARANAEQARLAQTESDRNAANAAVQQRAAEVAKAGTEKVNVELQTAVRNLDESNTQLETEKQNLAEANSNINASRLVALAEVERSRGNLDTAMLLANQAMEHTTANSNPARFAQLAIQQQASQVERYLPGRQISLEFRGSVVARDGRLAMVGTTTAGFGIQVWDPGDPTAEPLYFDQGSRPPGIGIDLRFVDGDTRLVVSSTDGSFTVWDTVSGQRMLDYVGTSQSCFLCPPLVSPDGTKLVVNEGQNVVAFDLHTLQKIGSWPGRLVADLGCAGELDGVATSSCVFSPDSRYVLGWADNVGVFVLWDTAHPQVTTTLYTPTVVDPALTPTISFLDGHDGLVVGIPDSSSIVVFDADGSIRRAIPLPSDNPVRALAVSEDYRTAVSVDDAGVVVRIDLDGGSVSTIAELSSQCANGVALSPRGQWVAVAIGYPGFSCEVSSVGTWYLEADGSSPPEGPYSVTPDAFGHDGAGNENSVIGANGYVQFLHHGDEVAFNPGIGYCRVSPAKNRIVCGNVVVDLNTSGSVVRTLHLPAPVFVAPPVFDHTGTRVFSPTSAERVVQLYAEPRRPGELRSQVSQTLTAYASTALSPDGTQLAEAPYIDSIFSARDAELRSLRDGTVLRIPGDSGQSITSLTFTNDGRRLLIERYGEAFEALPAQVVDTATGAVIGPVRDHVVSSGDGLVLATWDDGGDEIELVSADDLKHVGSVPAAGLFGSIAVDRDGSRLAGLDGDGILTIIDTTTGSVEKTVELLNYPNAVAFSHDERTLAVTYDIFGLPRALVGASLIDVDRRRTIATVKNVADNGCFPPWDSSFFAVPSPTFSPDDALLMVGGQFLDATNLAPIGEQIGCSSSQFRMGVFSNSTTFSFLTMDAVDPSSTTRPPIDVREIAVGLEALRAGACAKAGRNLTASEWERFEPDAAYRRTCSQWPDGT